MMIPNNTTYTTWPHLGSYRIYLLLKYINDCDSDCHEVLNLKKSIVIALLSPHFKITFHKSRVHDLVR